MVFDENWNGNITLEELGKAMNSSGRMLSNDKLKTVIIAMDKNGNAN